MGASRKAKSGRAQRTGLGESPRTREMVAESQCEVAEVPPGVINEIETQRAALVTVITLLHCLHVVLERGEERTGELNPRLEAAVRWASLPEMTAMLLERTHAVLSALDSMNLTNTSKALRR